MKNNDSSKTNKAVKTNNDEICNMHEPRTKCVIYIYEF